MIHIDPKPGYSQLRVASIAVGVMAVLTAASGAAGNATVLAWVVAAIATMTFVATFYLKP
jgi:hypothetical protein